MKTIDQINAKILSQNSLNQRLKEWTSESIVFTNGCFDILHRGHITYLAQAKDFGSKLIIGLNTDRSVKALNKGDNRPINNENDRAFQLAALSFTDGLILFDEDTPLSIITKIQPDVLVKGGDYNTHQEDPQQKDYIVGAREVKANGGKVVTIPLVKGYSTTNIITQIKS